MHGVAEMGQSRARSFSNLETATQRNFMNSREEKGKLGAMATQDPVTVVYSAYERCIMMPFLRGYLLGRGTKLKSKTTSSTA